MAQINNIENNEQGSSVRAKLNSAIAWVNDLISKVFENSLYSLIFGYNAGQANTTGQLNTFIGYRAGEANIDKDHQTFIGTYAGLKNDGLFGQNTAVGAESLQESTTGGQNTAVGYGGQKYSKYAGRNSTLGAIAMQQITNGNYGVAVGYQSQGSGRYIYRNVSVGYKSLRDNVVGRDNVAVGYKALQDMVGSNGAITAITDVGGGQVQITAAGHGRINGETVYIIGTGPWADHSWTDNYDGDYVISNVSTDTFEITIAYIDPGLLYDLGYWHKEFEAVGNVAMGYATGINLATGSYNTLLGYSQNVADPDGDGQLSIHFAMITGFYGGDIRQRWIKVDGKLVLGEHTDVPYGAVEGAMYYNSTDKHFYGYNGTAWKQLDN